jgi:predicted NUDIX family NTP pyrophosphohydrolase
MAAESAGILMYRRREGGVVELLLIHPGGPYWRNKDAGAWSIPKGEYGPDEKPEAAARREFAEELGFAAEGVLRPLGDIRQKGGKRVTAFALEGDLDTSSITSISFEMEWPRGSGRMRSFPEVDRADWFTLAEAREKILASQTPLIDRLLALLGSKGDRRPGD